MNKFEIKYGSTEEQSLFVGLNVCSLFFHSLFVSWTTLILSPSNITACLQIDVEQYCKYDKFNERKAHNVGKQCNAQLFLNGAAILKSELEVVEVPLILQPEIPSSENVSDDMVSHKLGKRNFILLQKLYILLILSVILSVVSEAEVCSEAEELEMQTDRYVQDLHQALTETENTTAYTFSLTPSPPDNGSALTLAYEKVQRDIAVSKHHLISENI